jgi:hypothetical protein
LGILRKGRRDRTIRPVIAYVLGAAIMGFGFAPVPSAQAGGHPADPAAPPSPAEIDQLLRDAGGAAAGTALAPQIGAEPKSVTVPFLFEGGHIILEAVIDGHAAKPFIFDTGAMTTVTSDIAAEFHLPSEGNGELISGIGENLVATEDVLVKNIVIGTASLGPQKITAAKLRNVLVDRGARPPAAGLIGVELLRDYVVRIDYAAHQLTLIPAGTFRPPSDGFSLPLTVPVVKEGRVSALIPAEIEHVPGQFIVDTGSGSDAYISAGFERDHKLLAHYPKTLQILTAGGIGGNAPERVGFGESFTLGPVSLSMPFVTTPAGDGTPYFIRDTGPSPGTRPYQPKPDEFGSLFFSNGLIGNGVLANFTVTFDYKGQRIYFQSPRGTKLSEGWYGTGLIVDKPEHESFEIIDILPGTAAASAKLHTGDRIVAVNGDPARDLGISDFGARNGKAARKNLKIEMADGRQVDLTIGQLLP